MDQFRYYRLWRLWRMLGDLRCWRTDMWEKLRKWVLGWHRMSDVSATKPRIMQWTTVPKYAHFFNQFEQQYVKWLSTVLPVPAQRRVGEARRSAKDHAITETGAMWDAQSNSRFVLMLAMNRVVKVTIIQRLHDKKFLYSERSFLSHLSCIVINSDRYCPFGGIIQDLKLKSWLKKCY